MLDVFKGSAFTTVALTAAINKAPFKPSRLGQLGLFSESGITSTTAVVEEKDGQLELVQTSPRGGPATAVGSSKRTARAFMTYHVEKIARIVGDSVQGVRAFGSDSADEAVATVVSQRLATLRAMIEVTLEYHRVNAMKGVLLDADGSTLVDLFTAFGVAQNTGAIDTSAAVRSQVVALIRSIESELGATPVSSYRAFCGKDFFDTLIEADSVAESLKYQEGAVLRTDVRTGFQYGGVTWEEYRGSVSGQAFVADDKAYLVPEGTDLFQTYFAPADYIEAVNTIGLPLYAKLAVDEKWNKHVDVQAQSNPLCLCLRPRAVVEVSIS